MKRAFGLLFVLLLAVALPLAAADSKVRCESNDGHYRECPVGNADVVTLARTWSKTKCVRGESWGFKNGVIWVDEGCRADFNVSMSTARLDNNRGVDRLGTANPPMTSSMAETLVCESTNNRRNHCSANTAGGVYLVRQISKNSCDFKKDWGFDQNGVWVEHGCRAEFALGGEVGLSSMYTSSSTIPKIVVCESEDGKAKHCSADTRFGVALYRRLSDAGCIMHRTWGFDRDGIWVSGGCRAEFQLNPNNR